jgi:hypothetical protein
VPRFARNEPESALRDLLDHEEQARSPPEPYVMEDAFHEENRRACPWPNEK